MEILNLNQWVAWRYDVGNDGKQTKIPYNIKTGARASVSDQDTWASYKDCVEATKRVDLSTGGNYYNGIGFVFTDTDPFACIDIDDLNDNMCFDIEEILEDFDTYKELSYSENGIHIIFKGTKKKSNCRTNKVPWLEIYDKNRWLAITGNIYQEAPKELNDCQEQLDKLMDKYFPTQEIKTRTLPTTVSDLSDEEIVEIASKSQNGDKFKELWSGNTVGADQSGNDQALCNILAFYTQGNSDQIDRLFRQSGLMRDKWDKREDYRRRTISKAIEGCNEFYKPTPKIDLSYIKVNLQKIRKNMTVEEISEEVESNETEDWVVPGVLEAFDDISNAKYFYNNHKEDYLYSKENWYKWNGKKWALCGDLEIRKEVQSVPSELRTLFKGIEDKSTKKEAMKWAKTTGGTNHLNAIVTECRTLYSNDYVEFDKDPHLINCLSGVINLKTMELYEHDRKYYCSKIVNCQINQEIPQEFLAFLGKALYGDQEIEEYLRKALGYCLTGENSEQTAYFLCGQGQTGKSTLLKLIGDIMGEYNYNAPSGMFMDSNSGGGKFDLVNLYGKRLCCTSELTSAKNLASEIFKKVTGGDTQDCDRKFKQPLRVEFKAKVLVATNDLPSFNPDYAIKRRLKFIKFDRLIETPDSQAFDKLWKERDAIFSWLVVGANKYYQEGVGELDSMKKFKEEAIKSNNAMLTWFEETYNLVEDEGFVPRDTIWNEWISYCDRNKIHNYYNTPQGFIKCINSTYKNKGVIYKQITGGERGFIGIRKRY